MNYLSLDVGTTCCKCQLFSDKGEILAYLSREYALKKSDGEIYVDIHAIWKNVCDLIAFAKRKGDIHSVCISSFGESFVLLDKQDNLLFDPMLYTDARGEKQAEEIAKKFSAEEYFSRTGTLPQSLFSVSKLLWIKENKPHLYKRADKVLLICDYIGYLLTGKRVIDYGLASRTGVLNINTLEFDDAILNALGIEKALFSKPMQAGAVVGKVKADILENCTLILGSHDQICTTLGAGIVESGQAVDGLGTVECITAVFDKKPENVEMGKQGYVCAPYAVNGLYCTYMFNYTSGALINWYKNEILHNYRGEQENFFSYIESKLGDVPTDILCLPYFSGASTPYQNINAKGAFVNLTTKTTDGELYRAILESLAYEMKLNVETVMEYGIRIDSLVATGGGANSKKWLQIKADIQSVPIQTLRSSEGGLCGCAMLTAVAMGSTKDLKDAASVFVQYKDEFLPDHGVQYCGQYEKYKKLYKTIKELY